MKILILTKYASLGASSRVRFLQYIPFLKNLGYQVDVSPLLDNEYISKIYTKGKISIFYLFRSYLRRIKTLFGIKQYDLIWIENELFPYLPAKFEFIFLRKKLAWVVGYDDAIFHNYDRNKSFIFRKFLSSKIDLIMQNARCVIAGNDYIAERAKKAGSGYVVTIPSVVDIDKYTIDDEKKDKDIFVIGWIGTPKTEHYLQVVKGALRRLAKIRNIELFLVGSKGIDGLDGVKVVYNEWSENTEVELIKQMDVGIMPLCDDYFERGKCGYKLIQYMACGKPVIASPVGVNSSVVTQGASGYLAASESDWLKFLVNLCDDSVLRKKMGDFGRRKVETEYSVQSTVQALVSAFNNSL